MIGHKKNIERMSLQIFSFFHHTLYGLATLSFLLPGCAKKVTVNGQDVDKSKQLLTQSPETITEQVSKIADEPPKPQAQVVNIDLPDGFSSDREYFQSRSSITLTLSGKIFEPGDEFSMINQTSGQPLVEKRPISLQLFDNQDDFYDLMATQSDIFIKIYPLSSEYRNKLAYGTNNLELKVKGQKEKTAKRSVVLRDFNVFGVQTLRFADSKQKSGALQGEVSGYLKQVVKGHQSVLSSGFLMMVNQ